MGNIICLCNNSILTSKGMIQNLIHSNKFIFVNADFFTCYIMNICESPTSLFKKIIHR